MKRDNIMQCTLLIIAGVFTLLVEDFGELFNAK